MKKILSLTLGMVLMTAGLVLAQQTPLEQSQIQLVEVGNKTCPVSHQKVGEMGPAVKYVYNGKIYNLCCPMCKHTFDSNQDKYSKIAEKDAIQNGQYH